MEKSLTFDGAGEGSTIVQAHADEGAGADRVFNIPGGLTYITMQEMTIRHGNVTGGGAGGGVYHASGWLDFNQVEVRNNDAEGNGGGLYNDSGIVRMSDATLSGNASGGRGGGLCNVSNGLGILSEVTISTNNAGANGGGIHNGGALTLDDVVVLDNNAVAEGGGVNSSGSGSTVAFRDSQIDDNDAGGNGGAIRHSSGGVMTLENSTLSDNTSGGEGGGIKTDARHLYLTDCAVSRNTASGNGGGVYRNGEYITINRSTINGNATGGMGWGIFTTWGKTIWITNSTISGNTADGHGGGIGQGNFTNNIYLYHVTLTANTADEDEAGGGNGGGIYHASNSTYKFFFMNSIIAGNMDKSSSGEDDCGGTNIFSQGYNLVGSGTGCPSDGVGDLTTTDPTLGILADFGGATKTHPLLHGSPALDQIPSGTSGCGDTYTEDQRGESRPFPGGNSCDMGAYEAQLMEYCDAELKEGSGAAGDNIYEFGDNTVAVHFDTGGKGELSCLAVEQINVSHPRAPAELQTGRYWIFTPTGSGYVLNLTLPHNSVPDDNDGICRYNGNEQDWTCFESSHDTVNNTMTAGAITELSEWATGTSVWPIFTEYIYLPFVMRN